MRTLAAGLAALGIWACSSDQAPTGCTTSSDCGTGRVCDAGTCKAVTGRTVGEACTSDVACSVGSSCASAMPGGLCTYSCAGDSCPTDAACTDLRASGSGILCSKMCATDADCRSGYTCCAGWGTTATTASAGACVPPANCPPKGRTASADLGKPCTATSCAAGEICGSGPEFPGGACTAGCNPADQTTCPAGSSCISTSTGSFCFAICSVPADCTNLNAQLSCTGGLCRSSTASAACTPPGTPMFATGSVGPPNPPAAGSCPPPQQVQPSVLNAQKFGAQVVATPLTVNVPPGTGSISILSQGVSVPVTSVTFNGNVIPNSVVPTQLKDPGGNLLFDDLPPPPADPSNLQVFYGGISPYTGMMTLPNSTLLLQHTALQGGFTPGPWRFEVNDFARECTQTTGCTKGGTSDTYDIQVVLKPGIAPSTGTVDVAFYLVGTNLTASTVAADPGMKRMLQTLGQLYAGAGLCLGTVTFYDVPAWARTKYASGINPDDESVCGDMSQMFTLSAPGNQLNFFLLDAFTLPANSGPQPVGVDGTIPGPSATGGTIQSGASVVAASLGSLMFCSPSTIDPLNCGPDEVAYITAHEGGHWMGLYHTTERHGDSFDPLTDTPTCACNVCASSADRPKCPQNKPPAGTIEPDMNNATCMTSTCGGGDNLMFWLLGTGARGRFSPQQGQVVRANPVVR